MFTINSVIDYFVLGDTKIEHKLMHLEDDTVSNKLALIFLKRNHLKVFQNSSPWIFNILNCIIKLYCNVYHQFNYRLFFPW